MKVTVISLAAALALAGCTSNERIATGTVAGAVVGGAIASNPAGVVAGALIGGFGTFIAESADGRCQYRNSRGQIYTTRCHWL